MFKKGIVIFETIVNENGEIFRYDTEYNIYEDLNKDFPIFYLKTNDRVYKKEESIWILQFDDTDISYKSVDSLTFKVICGYSEEEMIEKLLELHSNSSMKWIHPLEIID